MKNLIIFDFDGVLVDSLKVWYFINKAAAAKLGGNLSKAKYLDSFLGNVHAGLKEVLGLNAKQAAEFSEYKSRLIKRFYKPSNVKFFAFASPLINYLFAKFNLCIVTSSPESAVRGLLRRNKLEKRFKKIYGLNRNGKRHILRKLAKQYSKHKLLFVTDTTGDIKEAKISRIPTVAVGWGFHKPKQLQAAKPEKFILKPRQLWSLFK